MIHSTQNYHIVKRQKPSYQELRDAYATMIGEMLQSFPWDWWVSLTTKKQLPLDVLRRRFFWWLKAIRKLAKHHHEHLWIIERQRRGALHVHVVIYNVPTKDRIFWQKAIELWEKWHARGGKLKFGSATIVKYDPKKAGELSIYLAKERCKDLGRLEGSGSLFEKIGFSRGVKRYLDTPVDLRRFL